MTVVAALLAFGAMIAFGVAEVLQAVATPHMEEGSEEGLDPRLLLHLLHRPVFLESLALNGLGFALHIASLQTLPLFLVQTIVAGSVAVTAVLSVRVFGVPLVRGQWVSVGLVVLGLALLGPTATSGDATHTPTASPTVLALAVVVVGIAALGAVRVRGTLSAVLLGLLAGVGFGILAVCARLLPTLGLELLRTPTAYVLVAAGLTAFLLYSAAMQRGSVTTTTAAMVITQTAVPALVGVLVLGDGIRHGLLPLAVAGFALALAGVVGLGRYEREAAPVA